MTKVTFIHSDGISKSVEAEAGSNLLTVAQSIGEPLEGACEGQMACSTCHVIVDADDFEKLPVASEMEEDMLDLAVGVRRCSRLACQIVLDDDLERLTVHVPAEWQNMQGI